MKLLLKFIEDLLNKEGNEWFHDELAVLFSKKIISERDTGIKLSAVTLKQHGSIDKYLDNGLIPIIDYSGIEDQKTRFQLERDAIEMGKFRISNFDSTISFVDFCKYAHFQSEELINYYYHKKSDGEINKAKEYIKEFNPAFNDSYGTDKQPYSSISSIPYSLKQYAISRQLQFIPTFNYTLSNISKVRNIEIHKDSSREIDEKLKKFILREDFNQIFEALMYLRDKVIISIMNVTKQPKDS